MPDLPLISRVQAVIKAFRRINQLPQRLRSLPAGIWALGFTSLFMDISSELIHSLLPVFITVTLGASMITLGLIEGIAESTAAIVRIFSGSLSDYLRQRKLILMLGYTLAALTKPFIPTASSVGVVLAARFTDRVGKGIRGAPRDALVADITPLSMRGAAYGLRQALDSIGAFIGPTLALFLMIWLANDIRSAMWFAVLPAFLAVFILGFCLKEPASGAPGASASSWSFSSLFAGYRELPTAYWFVVMLGLLFTLARFSEAFLILRAQDVGLPITYAPVIMIVMNTFYALFAFPAGSAADHLHYRHLLLGGLGLLVLADVVLAAANTPWMAFAGAGLWGLHMALTQGLLSKLVADAAPVRLRGTAFGIFGLVTGIALLFASVLAGLLWSAFGSAVTFLSAAGFATLAAFGLLAYHQ